MADNLLDRNAWGVAAVRRANPSLQIKEVVSIEQFKRIARVTTGNAFAICRAVKALVEEGIRVAEGVCVFRVEGEVLECIAIVEVELEGMFELIAEREFAVIFIAAKVEGLEETD